MKTKFWALCGVMLSGLVCVSDLSGVEYTWNGGTDSWGTATNWTPNTTGTSGPGNGDTAIITTGTVNSFNGGRSGLTIRLSGGTLETSNNVAFLGNSLVEITGTGNFNSSHQVQPRVEIEPSLETSIKYGLSENPFLQRGRIGGRLNIEQEILELLRSLDSERMKEVLGVLGNIVEMEKMGVGRKTREEGGAGNV
ncbi:MAG: hypothetical protein Q4D62_13200 [Planctomycetia bacterium]|nr:hypothetical protein [Planctomycetia bacterium]